MSEKPRIAFSFSGGRTSAVMVYKGLEKYSDTHDIVIPFANTGCEAEQTLDFVNAVDRNICQPKGHKVIWIEAEIHGSGKGPTAKIVDYKSASRNGEPFEAAIAKHGIFCASHPNCTGRLKADPIRSYLRSIGWGAGTYDLAIGIRADEADRMSKDCKKNRVIYPLVEAGWRKQDVNELMAQFEWDLKLPHDAWGNCTWCWKKSFRKLMTITKEDPSVLDFPGKMERKYGMVSNHPKKMKEPRTFFRGYASAQDIMKRAFTEDFEPYQDDKFDQLELFNEVLDTGSGCGSSCEIGADE